VGKVRHVPIELGVSDDGMRRAHANLVSSGLVRGEGAAAAKASIQYCSEHLVRESVSNCQSWRYEIVASLLFRLTSCDLREIVITKQQSIARKEGDQFTGSDGTGCKETTTSRGDRGRAKASSRKEKIGKTPT